MGFCWSFKHIWWSDWGLVVICRGLPAGLVELISVYWQTRTNCKYSEMRVFRLASFLLFVFCGSVTDYYKYFFFYTMRFGDERNRLLVHGMKVKFFRCLKIDLRVLDLIIYTSIENRTRPIIKYGSRTVQRRHLNDLDRQNIHPQLLLILNVFGLEQFVYLVKRVCIWFIMRQLK